MNERDIRRTFRDPTANAALNGLQTREPRTSQIGQVVSPQLVIVNPANVDNVTRRQEALTELNSLFPEERRKRYVDRDPEFIRRRNEIMEGNF